MSKELSEAAKPYFEAYPNEQCVIFTSDGMAFFNKNRNDALAHARSLNEKELKEVQRPAETTESLKGGIESGENDTTPTALGKPKASNSKKSNKA